ncbi:MAG: OmpH family outer membrane protein [bacterium]
MRKSLFGMGVISAALMAFAYPTAAQIKIGYVDSQKILESYKEAQDAQKQLAEVNKGWEDEARNMQRELQTKQDELESQALLLSDEKRKEKETDLQNLYLRFQQFQQEKWGQQGEAYKKQNELMKPIIEKVQTVIKKLGADEKYDYIFDTIAGNIVYAGTGQPDLTAKVIEELNKAAGATTTKSAATKSSSN